MQAPEAVPHTNLVWFVYDSTSFYFYMTGVCVYVLRYPRENLPCCITAIQTHQSLSASQNTIHQSIISSIYILFPSCISFHMFTSDNTDSYSPFSEALFDWNLTKHEKDEISSKHLIYKALLLKRGANVHFFICYTDAVKGGLTSSALLSLSKRTENKGYSSSYWGEEWLNLTDLAVFQNYLLSNVSFHSFSCWHFYVSFCRHRSFWSVPRGIKKKKKKKT